MFFAVSVFVVSGFLLLLLLRHRDGFTGLCTAASFGPSFTMMENGKVPHIISGTCNMPHSVVRLSKSSEEASFDGQALYMQVDPTIFE